MTDPADPIADLAQDLQGVHTRLLDLVGPHRADLFAHCRRLTGSLWDAEDLLQDTLLRLLSAYARSWQEPPPLRPLLFRIATRAWIDRWRRRQAEGFGDDGPEPAAAPGPDPVEVGEAAERLFQVLPPRERAAVALVDALGLDAAEAAACIGSTPGAVRVALHRGRLRLRSAPPPPAVEAPAIPAVVHAFCAAFARRDLAGCTACLLDDAESEVVGCVQEFGRAAIAAGSLAHTLAEPDDPQAVPAIIDGEPVVLIHYRTAAGPALGDVVRVRIADGAIAGLHHHFFCPELLAAVAAGLGGAVRGNGWRYGAPG
ncbi:MAG: hypothetical protein RLZZ127_543 [Planctomycetota bacterium]|jgi:RNA polymerase sigma-70 factor (ECF subfamily)